MKKLCIYHGNCADGFGAAWVVRRKFGDDVEFHAGTYQESPPDTEGRDVIMVDFSYKLPVMTEMLERAASIKVIDHHKTAQAELEPLVGAGNFSLIFSLDHSGAMLTWNHYFPDVPAPSLIAHIEDRDLWKFKLEGTREIQANVFSYPYDFEVWDDLMKADPKTLAVAGEAIERKHFKDIDELVTASVRRMTIGGHNVPVANLPYTLSSDAGHKMGKGEPFAACYMDGPNGRTFSLRSSPEGVDVSEVAKKYGGGGHKNAAGFKMPIGWEGEAA